jgi:hypothetical protein
MTDTAREPRRSAEAARTHPLADPARRALAMWPRLDRRALRRCASDPACIATHVARRTNLPPEIIRAILGPGLTEEDGEIWFG